MRVSVCTPTFNRRPFIPYMIKCFEHQTYPKDLMEWVIVDDGTDSVADLVAHLPGVKYVRLETKIPLGQKRNLMHSNSTGEIIVYMDDDDYYPPERVAHAVHMLQTHPKALCAGSSILHTYFRHLGRIVEFGPYGPNHATAGTFAFKRALLADTAYEDHASLAEEKAFLKNYTVPFVQLDPRKTILVFSHEHNTFDKRTLLAPGRTIMKDAALTVADFVKDAELAAFYTEGVHAALEAYPAGAPANKPDVLAQIAKTTESKQFGIRFGDKTLYGDEIVQHLNQMKHFNDLLKQKIKEHEKTIQELRSMVKTMSS
jgi:glycosyltransferase involved in cell wall biosynthesis